MNFDPTKNYYGIDISFEPNHLIFDFWEFIKLLVTLSSPSEKQIEIGGCGNVIDEMTLEFSAHFPSRIKDFSEHELVTKSQVIKLNSLDELIKEWDDEKYIEIPEHEILDKYPFWNEVRLISKDILTEMGYCNLNIEIDRSIHETKSHLGERLIIESTKTLLKTKQ